MEVPALDEILDAIVTDVRKEYPDKSEFEAAFMALRLNLTILVQSMAEIGVRGYGLASEQLYGVCSGLAETVQWMAAKEMAAETVRDFDNGSEL